MRAHRLLAYAQRHRYLLNAEVLGERQRERLRLPLRQPAHDCPELLRPRRELWMNMTLASKPSEQTQLSDISPPARHTAIGHDPTDPRARTLVGRHGRPSLVTRKKPLLGELLGKVAASSEREGETNHGCVLGTVERLERRPVMIENAARLSHHDHTAFTRTTTPQLVQAAQIPPAAHRRPNQPDPTSPHRAATARRDDGFARAAPSVRAMRFWSFGAGVALALAAACSDSDPKPVGDLHNASAAADGSTVWVVGGTVVSDAVWEQMTTPSFELPAKSKEAVDAGASEHAVQYDLEGHVLQDLDLGDLSLGSIPSLGDMTARSASGGTVLAGTACLQKSDSPSDGCTLTPVALAVHDGRIERVAFDTDYGGAEDIRVVGALGPEVLVAIATQVGAALGNSNEVDLFAIDPARSDARRIALPSGVMFTRALCLRGGELMALTIDLDEAVAGVAGTLQVGVVDSLGAIDAPVSIPLDEQFPGAAAIVCRDDLVTALEVSPPDLYSSDTALLLHDVDLTTGTVTGSSKLPLIYTSVPSLESIGGDLLLIEGYSTSEARPVRWSAGTIGTPGPAATMYRGDLVVVGDQLLDVRGLLAMVPGGNAIAPTEIPVPPLS
jgi:hypothetical protein